MKLSKKIMALAAGIVLTLGLSISLTSCGDLLNAAQKVLENLVNEMTEEEQKDAEDAEDAAPEQASDEATTTEPVGGSFQFDIASTGTTNTFYYFDTSRTNSFSYVNDGTTYNKCYYQFQFTKKSASSGKWYLYMRSGSTVLKYNDSYSDQWGKSFIAYGSYEGNCFQSNAIADVAAGKLTLYTEKNYKWADLDITTSANDPKASFNVTFTASGNSGANINSARADAVEK